MDILIACGRTLHWDLQGPGGSPEVTSKLIHLKETPVKTCEDVHSGGVTWSMYKAPRGKRVEHFWKVQVDLVFLNYTACMGTELEEKCLETWEILREWRIFILRQAVCLWGAVSVRVIWSDFHFSKMSGACMEIGRGKARGRENIGLSRKPGERWGGLNLGSRQRWS